MHGALQKATQSPRPCPLIASWSATTTIEDATTESTNAAAAAPACFNDGDHNVATTVTASGAMATRSDPMCFDMLPVLELILESGTTGAGTCDTWRCDHHGEVATRQEGYWNRFFNYKII